MKDKLEPKTLVHYKEEYIDESISSVLICECGCDEFRVMQGSYYTAVQCVECEKKYCVHEG